ncbi:MAG: recombinase family protein [Clostridia bacterium]|nr:recombinase family protein [Clostridia bacterium]
MENTIRVAVYKRLKSPGYGDQTASYALLETNDKTFIKARPGWQYTGAYYDEGTGRTAFQQLLEDCDAGKIDLILTKSMGRFGDDLAGCIHTVQRLLRHDPPVGVFFECENLNTLDNPDIFFRSDAESDPILLYCRALLPL